jgi:ribosomal protein S18 acetylase RimI-like enzyme
VAAKKPAIRYRDARASDMVACADVFLESVADLSRRMGFPVRKRKTEVVAHRLGYLQKTDPRGFQVATQGDRIVAFGSAILREDVHYLSMLWARPSLQGKGVGRRVLNRAFNRPDPPATAVRCVMASLDSRAQSLYYRAGMLPRGMIYGLACDRPTRKTKAPEHPVEMSQVGEPGEVTKEALALAAAVDRKVRGCRRDSDIAFTLGQEGVRFFEVREGGDVVGYVMLSPDGMIGPGGVIDTRFTEGLAWAAIEGQRALGTPRTAMQLVSHNDGAMRTAITAGLRIMFPAVWMAQREFGKFDRYFATAGDIL